MPLDAPPEAHQPTANQIRMWNWLVDVHRVKACTAKLRRPTANFNTAWEEALEIADWGGLPVGDAPWAKYHFFVGPNADGVAHMIVGRLGVWVWDPNPRRRGIVEVTHVEWLVPVDLVPESARDLPAATWSWADAD